MTDRHSCPLCSERYGDRTELSVHLEVEHRKSEIVRTLVAVHEAREDDPSAEASSGLEEGPSRPSV